MNIYAALCRHLPTAVVNWLFVGARAVLMLLILLYYDTQFSSFAYLKT